MFQVAVSLLTSLKSGAESLQFKSFSTANKILHEDYKELIPRGIIKKGGAKIGYAW